MLYLDKVRQGPQTNPPPPPTYNDFRWTFQNLGHKNTTNYAKQASFPLLDTELRLLLEKSSRDECRQAIQLQVCSSLCCSFC